MGVSKMVRPFTDESDPMETQDEIRTIATSIFNNWEKISWLMVSTQYKHETIVDPPSAFAHLFIRMNLVDSYQKR